MADAPFQKTWQVGQAVLAADLNANIRDGFNYVLKDHPQARATTSAAAAQSISNATWTTVDLVTEVLDTGTDGLYTGGADLFDMAIPGLYLVTYTVTFDPNTTGGRAARLTRNGTADANAIPGTFSSQSAASIGHTSLCLNRYIYFARGDDLRLQVYQNSGGALGLNHEFDEISALQAIWVSSDTFIR